MNKTNFKLFTMFLAGIAFSAMTVLAATISISTNFEDGVTQYLKKLVILKNDNTTWMVLDWDTLNGENIYGTNITWTNIKGTNITWSNIYGTNITWTNIKGNKIQGQSGLFSQYCDESWQECKTIGELTNPEAPDQLWTKNGNKIYYTSGNVWIWTPDPETTLYVDGTGTFSQGINTPTINGKPKIDFKVNDIDIMTLNTSSVSIGNTGAIRTIKDLNVSWTWFFWRDIKAGYGIFVHDISANNASVSSITAGTQNKIKLYEGSIWFWSKLSFRSNSTEQATIENNWNFTIKTGIFLNWIILSGSLQLATNQNDSIIESINTKNLVFKAPNNKQIQFKINNQEKMSINNNGISAKTGYFSGMEIKGSDVKLLSTVFQKEFTWNYQNSWLYLPKWTTSWTQNDALATDSKRYISCNNFWTWIILLSLYKQWNTPFVWLQTYPFTKSFYAMLSFENTAFYELKAWESFSVNSTCSSWLIVSKQEYWWNTTSRE